MYPDGICFSADSAPGDAAKTAQWLFAGTLDPCGLATIFAGLEPTEVHYLAHFLVMPHANLDTLCPSIATEWDRLVQNTSARPASHSAATGISLLRKMNFKLNRWLNNAQH